jgi:hypothetical protein
LEEFAMSAHRRLTRSLSTLPLALALAACGSTPDKPTDGDTETSSACKQADARLRKQLGPELQAVTKRVPVTKPAVGETPAEPLGCAIVYTLVAEELVEEGLGEEAAIGGADQRLAFLTPDPKTRWNLTLIDPSPESPSSVDLELQVADITFDGVPEVVVRESGLGADSYQGVRLFSLTVSPEGPRDLLSESLKLKTNENVELFAQWKSTKAEGKPVVVFEAGGASRIFAWNDGEKRYQLDQAATTAANPPPPAPPSAEAPASAEPPPAPPTTAPAGKKAKGGKKAPAAPAKVDPIELP